MDIIYGHVEAVLIAASGLDVNCGLPGAFRMAQPSSSFRFPNTVLQCRRQYDTRPGASKLRPYIERRWTLQESLLARRRIIFTESEILFECSQATARESMGHCFEKPEPRFSLFGSLNFAKFSPRGNRYLYSSVVINCMYRKTAYEYDIKRAFEGIANHIAHRSDDRSCWTFPRKDLIWGLLRCPTETIDLPNHYPVRHDKEFEANVRRRQNAPGECSFPSWFWGAWVTRNLTWYNHFTIDIGTETSEKFVESWTEADWDTIEQTGFLHLDAEIVHVSTLAVSSALDSSQYLGKGAARRHWDAPRLATSSAQTFGLGPLILGIQKHLLLQSYSEVGLHIALVI